MVIHVGKNFEIITTFQLLDGTTLWGHREKDRNEFFLARFMLWEYLLTAGEIKQIYEVSFFIYLLKFRNLYKQPGRLKYLH